MKGTVTGIFVLCAAVLLAQPAGAAKKYKEAEVANGATISGKVTLADAKAKTQDFTIAKNPEVCGTGTRSVEWVRTNGGALLDAVVYLEEVSAGKPFADGARKVVMEQKGCRFLPYLQVMANGGELEVVNADPVAHNIHAYELIGRARKDLFNFQQPQKGHTKTEKIRVRRGNIVQLQCDIHDFMRGWIVVPQNPFGTVAKAGTFSIEGIPAGDRKIKAFHPVLGVLEKKVTLKDGATETVNFEFKSK